MGGFTLGKSPEQMVAEKAAIEKQAALGRVSREDFDKDIDTAQQNVRGLGPLMARQRLEDRGVDVEQLLKQKFQRPEMVQRAKGGKVNAYAKGGSVSSASKRADGCATKGKTRGKFV
jgi:hypothetical protein